jgi:hypothetical protein
MQMNLALGAVTLSFLVSLLAPSEARSDDFLVETDIFVGATNEPALQTRTLFASGVVYDFMLSGSREIVIFDPKRGKFVLLDREHQVQTSLANEEILKFTAGIQAASQEKGDEVFFQRDWSLNFDQESGWLELSGEHLQYRAKGIAPEDSGAARQYREFADWYARLNAMRHGNIPPFARIELNRALLNRGLLPTEIERTISVDSVPRRKYVVRSRHLAQWGLSNTDHKRIQDASELRATLEEVSFLQYRKIISGKSPDAAASQ